MTIRTRFLKALYYVAVTGTAFKSWAGVWLWLYAFVVTIWLAAGTPAMLMDKLMIATFAEYTGDWYELLGFGFGIVLFCAMFALALSLVAAVAFGIGAAIWKVSDSPLSVTKLPTSESCVSHEH